MVKRLGILFFVSLYLVCNLNAQTSIYQDYFIKNSKNASSENYGKKILTSLALGLNKDLKATQIGINYTFRKEIKPINKNSIEVALAISNIILEGDTKYRGFKLDSILIPDYGIVRLRVFNQSKLIYNQIVEISLEGMKIIIESDDLNDFNNQARVEVELINFKYSKLNFEQFDNISKLVNYYYGYGLIIENLNKKSREISNKNKEEASLVFLQWHVTSRVFHLINELNLRANLNLNSYDPENFIKKQKELSRHLRRATTLLNQTLDAELKKGFIADKQNYINGIIDFSEEIYKKGKQQQPYLQEAFRKATLINMAAKEHEMIRGISDYYDMHSYYNDPKISLLLYDNYVESAVEYLNESKNNMALRQLKNANGIQTYFKYQQSALYITTLAATLNGMIESFLKVSNMALKSGNYVMADNYYQNAEKVFNENLDLFQQTNITATPFSIYVDAQTKLAKQLIVDDKFDLAEKLLANCMKIQTEKGLEENKETRELIDKSRNGIYRNILFNADRFLNSGNVEEALSLIYESKLFKITYAEIDENELFEDISYSIFLEYFQNGEILLDRGKHDEAIENLLQAKEIQTKLLGYKVERLDEILKSTSVPVILDMIEEAKYQTWAKRPQDAQELKTQAETMQIIYHQQDNNDLNTALQTLEYKMISRHCIDLEFQIKENAKTTIKNINKGNFSLASQLLVNTREIVESNTDCNLSPKVIDSIVQYYIIVFEFFDKYELMKKKLFSQGYHETIDMYLKLRNYYFENDIGKFKFYLPSLYEFIKQQEQTNLTVSSVSYFIVQQQYQLAFEYLNLLKLQGFESVSSKDLQIELGTEFAKSFEDDHEASRLMAIELSGGDKWFKYFNRAMK